MYFVKLQRKMHSWYNSGFQMKAFQSIPLNPFLRHKQPITTVTVVTVFWCKVHLAPSGLTRGPTRRCRFWLARTCSGTRTFQTRLSKQSKLHQGDLDWKYFLRFRKGNPINRPAGLIRTKFNSFCVSLHVTHILKKMMMVPRTIWDFPELFFEGTFQFQVYKPFQ